MTPVNETPSFINEYTQKFINVLTQYIKDDDEYSFSEICRIMILEPDYNNYQINKGNFDFDFKSVFDETVQSKEIFILQLFKRNIKRQHNRPSYFVPLFVQEAEKAIKDKIENLKEKIDIAEENFTVPNTIEDLNYLNSKLNAANAIKNSFEQNRFLQKAVIIAIKYDIKGKNFINIETSSLQHPSNVLVKSGLVDALNDGEKQRIKDVIARQLIWVAIHHPIRLEGFTRACNNVFSPVKDFEVLDIEKIKKIREQLILQTKEDLSFNNVKKDTPSLIPV